MFATNKHTGDSTKAHGKNYILPLYIAWSRSEDSHVCFAYCSNQQRSLEPFMCLNAGIVSTISALLYMHRINFVSCRFQSVSIDFAFVVLSFTFGLFV